jgi:glycosyltransferase involved in cell wall biosynthesis
VFTVENAAVLQGLSTRKKDAGRLRKSLGLGKRHRAIVYTGSFVELQNLRLLIESVPHVIKKVPDARFILVGAKDERELGPYNKIAKGLGVSKYITFQKRQAPEHMPLYLEIADIVASPRTRGLNIPFKIYSLMGSKKPIIAPDTALYNTFLDSGNSMLVEPDPEKFAEGIVRLLRDTKLSKRLALQAYQKVEEKYSQQEYLRKMERFCEIIEKDIADRRTQKPW